MELLEVLSTISISLSESPAAMLDLLLVLLPSDSCSSSEDSSFSELLVGIYDTSESDLSEDDTAVEEEETPDDDEELCLVSPLLPSLLFGSEESPLNKSTSDALPLITEMPDSLEELPLEELSLDEEDELDELLFNFFSSS